MGEICKNEGRYQNWKKYKKIINKGKKIKQLNNFFPLRIPSYFHFEHCGNITEKKPT